MATTPVIDSGRPLGLPPEQQVRTDLEFNGTANSRNSRDRSKSTKDREDDGEENGVSTRKNSVERRAAKEREKANAADGALQAILERIDQHGAANRLEIGSNSNIIQIRIDLDAQNKRFAEMASALNAMRLQMEQLLVMGQQVEQTKDLVGNLQKGEVTLSDTKGLQDGILGLKEDILQSIRLEGEKIISKINEASSPEKKRPRKVPVGGRQRSVSFGANSEMEMESAVSPGTAFPQPDYIPLTRPTLVLRPTSTQPQQTDQSQPTNTGQQNGLTPRVPQPQGTLQGQQTARTDQNKQSYASTVSGRPVGLPVGPRREIRQSGTNNHGQQHQRQQNPPRDQRQQNPPPGSKTTK
jgi:hypothetical protein